MQFAMRIVMMFGLGVNGTEMMRKHDAALQSVAKARVLTKGGGETNYQPDREQYSGGLTNGARPLAISGGFFIASGDLSPRPLSLLGGKQTLEAEAERRAESIAVPPL